MLNPPDVLIVGGGVIGSAIAYFLCQSEDFDGHVVVLEQDPTYQIAATPRSVGGIRMQYSVPENVAISQFGVEFYANAAVTLAVEGEGPELSFRRAGYLIVASAAGATILEENIAMQREQGAETMRLEPTEMSLRFLSLIHI